MKNMIRLLILPLFVATAVMPHSAVADYQAELVTLFRTADQQSDWMKELLNKQEVDLSQLSLTQIRATITKLEKYKERMMGVKHAGKPWSTQDEQYLMLAQELMRQLTNARIACDQRMQSSKTMKKIAIPIGSAIAVAGGLVLLDIFTDLNIDTSTALLCGLATGVTVGAITYKGDMLEGFRALKDGASQIWRVRSLRTTGTVVAAMVGAAAAGGLIWQKRDAIAGTFGMNGSKKPLSQLAHEHNL